MLSILSKILFQLSSACPKYDKIFRKLLNNPDPDTDMYKFNQQHSDLVKYISKHSGEVCEFGFPLFQHFILYFLFVVKLYDFILFAEFHKHSSVCSGLRYSGSAQRQQFKIARMDRFNFSRQNVSS